MKTWHEALKILLEEIDLTEIKLAQMTGSSQSNISKFILGKSNGSLATLKKWLNACERYHKGAIKKFYLICLDEGVDWEIPPLKLKPQKFTVQDHVESMTPQELAKYLRAIGNRLSKGTDIVESCHQPEDRSSFETESLKS